MPLDSIQRALGFARNTVEALEAIPAGTETQDPPAAALTINKVSNGAPKLAVIVGHNERAQGAVREDTNESEYVYYNKIADMIEAQSGVFDIDVRIFNRKPSTGYGREIREVYSAADAWGADATVELHFNAASPRATGTETLSSGSRGSMEYAQSVQQEMVHLLGLPDRGIKIKNSRNKGRGYLSLVTGKAPAILIEPFFNEHETDLLKTKTDKQRRALARSILQGFDTVFDA